METSETPVEVFLSFAEADALLLKQLQRHLSILQHKKLISTWHKREIVAGSDWQVELDRHLNTASLILLLISPDFLASDYQCGVELQRAMERHNENEACVIPILLRPCDWQGTPFEKLQVIPRNRTPVTMWRNRDAGFTEVAREIRNALKNVERLIFATPPTALPKIWQIPYPRNPVFTGREELLDLLATVLQRKHLVTLSQPQTQAISGLGGVGKTQLAVEYGYRAAQQYQAVFWVSAQTPEMLISGYVRLAEVLKLQERNEQDHNVVVNAVRQWLHTHTHWLLILDNVNDLAEVEPLLPSTYGGHVLLTTRTQVTGRFAHRVDLNILTNEDGALLLLRRAGILAEQGRLEEANSEATVLAKRISAQLGNLPLALDQAGAYIEETGCDLEGYHQRYQQRHMFLLQQRGSFASDHPEPVATTWSLSFQKVEQGNTVAAELLRICAYLSPDAIPEELLAQALIPDSLSSTQENDEGSGHFPPIASDEELALQAEKMWIIDEAMAVLRTYSLIQRNAREKTLSIHRLVQAVLRAATEEQEERRWITRVISIVDAIFPEVEFETLKQCARYLPQAQECRTWIIQWNLLLPEGASVLHKAGSYLHDRGQYEQAEPFYQQALHIKKQALGPEHPSTATTLHHLAWLYQDRGQYERAEPLYQQALYIKKHALGSEHPSTAITLHALAWLHQQQGKYEQAEPLYQQALCIHEQTLGSEHPSTAITLHTLASLYQEQGKYKRAEPLYQQALHIKKHALGSEHPSTAITLHALAWLYQQQGKYEQAEPLYQQALHIQEQALGLEHPSIATILHALGWLYQEQGKYELAEPLYQQALHIREQALGLEHPSTAITLHALASLYQEQSKYEQVEPLYQQALRIYQQTLGSEHPSTAITLHALGWLYQQQGKYEQAEPLYQQALHIQEQALGLEHPSTATTLHTLAWLYQEQGKYELAEPLYQQALRIYQQTLGPEHHNTQTVHANYALLLQARDHMRKPKE